MTSPACPMCGAPMRRVAESTAHGHEWRRWMCPECLHEELDRTRECPICHEEHVPLLADDGAEVCPSCGHEYR